MENFANVVCVPPTELSESGLEVSVAGGFVCHVIE